MNQDPASPSTPEWAQQMTDAGVAPPAGLAGEGWRLLAWGLKDLCDASWSSEPSRAARAAAALRRLHDGARSEAAAAAAEPEIGALAEWTAGIAHLTRGEMADATRCLDDAAASFIRLGQPRHATQTQVAKIIALSMLGQHDAAAQCAEQARRDFIAHGDLHAASKVGLNLGSLHLRRDAYAQAAHHYREAAVLFARVGDQERSVMADIGFADALTAQGHFDEALRIYGRARMRASSHGFPVLQAMVEESLALLQLARGRYREALAGFEGSRRRYEQLGMPQHLAIAEKQLADAYLELRLLPEALALFDQALPRLQALDMPLEQAWTWAQRGRVQALLGEPEPAGESLIAAARLFAQQANRVGEAAVALARAELALGGGAAGAAVMLAGDAASGFDAAGLPERRLRADTVRAQALLHAGRIDAARTLFDTTLAAAEARQLLPVQLRCLTGLGLAARAGGERAAAQAAFDAAVELFEDQRRALPGDEVRSAFQSDHLLPFQELLRLALEAHEADPLPAAAAEVLRQLDRFRARTLGDRLGHGAVAATDDSTRDLRARLNWLYRRAQRLQDEAGHSPALNAELRAAERELLERTRRQRLVAGAVDELQAAAPSEDGWRLAALHRVLGEHDAIVEYGVLDDELFACVVTRDGVQLQRRLASWTAVKEAVRAARFQMETLRHGSALLAHHLPALTARVQARLARLHALVWAPMAALLACRRRLLVVPHAQLGAVPFAALHDGHACLAERHELALAPSVQVAHHGLTRPAVAAQQVVALGESTRLAHAAGEARLVAGLFAGGDAYVGADASIETLRANAGRADVIHLACHARFRADNPLFSALQLHDGTLTAEAIEGLRLKAGTVVLSACESGLHEHGGGDEMFGLARAFFVAGAARVVASLWPVDDAAAAEFMACFYAALRRGGTPAAALRDAQLALKAQRGHPFFWASFALMGGW